MRFLYKSHDHSDSLQHILRPDDALHSNSSRHQNHTTAEAQTHSLWRLQPRDFCRKYSAAFCHFLAAFPLLAHRPQVYGGFVL